MKRLAPLALLVLTVPAHAYVRQVTSNGTGIAFTSGCAFLTPDSKGTKDLPIDMVVAQIQAAADNWNSATTNCSYMHLNVDPPATSKVAALDGVNLTIWMEAMWGHTVNGMFVPYSPEVPAQTTIIFVDDPKSSQNGQILDADTELNGVNYHFGVYDTVPTTCSMSPCSMDIQNTLTHEYGHAIGLDHTCYNNETPIRPLDNNGNPSPTCGTPQAQTSAILEATMYNFATCCENKKRSPEADDVNGYCGIYPTAKNPQQCARVQPHGDQSGCACAIGARPTVPTALVVLTVLVCSRIRRRSGCAPAFCDRARSSGAA